MTRLTCELPNLLKSLFTAFIRILIPISLCSYCLPHISVFQCLFRPFVSSSFVCYALFLVIVTVFGLLLFYFDRLLFPACRVQFCFPVLELFYPLVFPSCFLLFQYLVSQPIRIGAFLYEFSSYQVPVF